MTKINKDKVQYNENYRFTDFERFFSIFEDSNNHYVYNLNETVYLDVNDALDYELDSTLFWTQISYRIYETTRLWWLLMKLNKVTSDKIFDPVEAGQKVKYIPMETVSNIISQI